MGEDLKRELINMDIFYFLQEEFELQFWLVNSLFTQGYFTAFPKYAGVTLTDNDFTYIKNNNILLRNKTLSNTTLYGDLGKELRKKLLDLFSFSIAKPYKSGKPHFTNIVLSLKERQILHFDTDVLYICLTDEELDVLKQSHQVDTSNWKLIKKKDNYNTPADYFTLSERKFWSHWKDLYYTD